MTIPVLVTPSGTILGTGPQPLVGVPAFFTLSTTGLVQETPQIIPIQPLAAQQISVTVNQQAVILSLYFKQIQVPLESEIPIDPPTYGAINPLFVDVYSNGQLIIAGVICQDRNRIVRNSYLGFIGDFAFIDTQLTDDPTQAGLGTRYLLTYWTNWP